MSQFHPDSEGNDSSLGVVVYTSAAQGDCVERQIVLRIADIPNEIVTRDGRFAIVVDARHADRARLELERYEEENRPRVAAPSAPVNVSSGWVGVAFYATVLVLVAALHQRNAFGLEWWNAGKAQAGLTRAGEWWRTVTALCLHAGPVHLTGNLLFGSVFGWLGGQRFGSGLAWFGILLSGALGNVLSAYVQLPSGSSVGASTAVFGALGILTTHVWRTTAGQGRRALVRWAPIVSGLPLSLLGSGGERTNVFAHATGFGFGALIGLMFASLPRQWLVKGRNQVVTGAVALALVVGAWVLAL